MKYWYRKGFYYYCSLNLYNGKGTFMDNVDKKLDFFTYHRIKLIYGNKKLEQMALNSVFRIKD